MKHLHDFASNRPASGRRPSRRGVVAAGLLAGGLLASVLVGGTAQAAPPGVTCGSTLTADTTLRADLRCRSGDGLILASGVTLDLGGHSLVGPGASGVGVQAAADSTGGNTIRNGTIKNWTTGISIDNEGMDRLQFTVADVTLRRAPLQAVGPWAAHLTRVTVIDSLLGTYLGADLDIAQAKLVRSPVEQFRASASIVGSTVVQSPMRTGSGGRIIIDTSVLDGRGTSDLVYLSETGVTITNSTVKKFKSPISGWWGSVTLTGNTFVDMPNGVLGPIADVPGFGPPATIVGNRFIRSGVVLRADVPMVVENNTFVNNTVGADFLVAEGSRAVGNVLYGNSGNAITTELPGLTVGGNTAKRNGGYGIYAPGAVDQGGNVAFGNRTGQCVGVVCTARR